MAKKGKKKISKKDLKKAQGGRKLGGISSPALLR